MISLGLQRSCLVVCCAIYLTSCVQTGGQQTAIVPAKSGNSTGLTIERPLADGPGFSAYLVSYVSSGLKVFAMVAVPKSVAPTGGFPVLVANHGFHPDPPKYGFTPDGIDSRPGDYYRAIPAKFAQQGFIVVMPDYRGHNVSEGKEFTKLPESTTYYKDDVVALLPRLASLENGNTRNLFLWGHSMGGVVAVKTILEAASIRAVSIWSTARIGEAQRDALKSVKVPIQIHHATGDKTTSIEWSQQVAKTAADAGTLANYHTYAVDDHFFKQPQLDQAVERDALFFRKHLDIGASVSSPTR